MVLTARQIQIVNLLAKGMMDKQIAHELGLSNGTVKSHLLEIRGRLGAEDRLQVVLKAMLLGLIDGFPPEMSDGRMGRLLERVRNLREKVGGLDAELTELDNEILGQLNFEGEAE